jgi:ketosteroid isomerase-like protein
MALSNVEIVKTIFEAWRNRDPEAAFEHIDPNIEVDISAVSPVPAAVGRGSDRLQQIVADWLDAWESLEYVPQSFVDAGNDVLVGVRIDARGRVSGAPVTYDAALVYTLSNGLVVGFRAYPTLAAAAKAVGIQR